jgi:hypothetical protein
MGGRHPVVATYSEPVQEAPRSGAEDAPEGIVEKVSERETIFEGVGAKPPVNRSRRVDHFGNRLPTDLVVGLASHYATQGRTREACELLRLKGSRS